MQNLEKKILSNSILTDFRQISWRSPIEMTSFTIEINFVTAKENRSDLKFSNIQ
jgi:hypothetical protein